MTTFRKLPTSNPKTKIVDMNSGGLFMNNSIIDDTSSPAVFVLHYKKNSERNRQFLVLIKVFTLLNCGTHFKDR